MQTFHFLKVRHPRSDKHPISPHNITPESRNEGYENIGNDPQLKKLLIVEQILLVSTLGNVLRTIWRICILMFELMIIF